MYGDYIAYDCWLGKVYDLKNQIILKLSNGARYIAHHKGAVRSVGQPLEGGEEGFSHGPAMIDFIRGHDRCCGHTGPGVSAPDPGRVSSPQPDSVAQCLLCALRWLRERSIITEEICWGLMLYFRHFSDAEQSDRGSGSCPF